MIYNHIPNKAGDDTDTGAFTKLQDEACGILVDWPHLKPRRTTQPATTASK